MVYVTIPIHQITRIFFIAQMKILLLWLVAGYTLLYTHPKTKIAMEKQAWMSRCISYCFKSVVIFQSRSSC